MKLDAKQIETAGVNALMKYFNYSETMHPSISTEDKNPVWDGKILLYHRGGKNKNESLVGQIMLQVKALSKESVFDTINRRIDVNELRIYKDNGGVAYFVVYVNPQTQQETIYYRLLAPIELRNFIDKAGIRKSHTIKFKRLPVLSNKVEHEFYDFFQDCKKQLSHVDSNLINIDDINDVFESLKFNMTCESRDEICALEEMSVRPSFMYGTIKGDKTNTLHPIGNSRFNMIFSISTDMTISVNGVEYYNDCSLEIENGIFFLVFGDGCFRIPFFKDECCKFCINPTFNTLNQTIRGLEFILAVNKNNGFLYGENKKGLKIDSTDYISYVKERLVLLKPIKKVLDILHVKEDLTLKNLSAEEVENLNLLTRHYLDGLYVYPNGPKENQRVIIKISNISLWFLFEYDDCRDSYDMISAYDLSSRMFRITTPDNQIVRAPYFAAFDRNTFEKACNINYSDFVHECNNLEPCNQTQIDYIIYLLFVMLNAYDAQQKKNPELLQTAFDICKWINDVNEEEKNIIDYKLHLFQIIKRQRKLNDEEIGFLYEVLDSEESDCEIKFVVNILLDNKRAAKRYFEKLNVEKQTELSQMPIYRFM